jgi:hypothetical protein
MMKRAFTFNYRLNREAGFGRLRSAYWAIKFVGWCLAQRTGADAK